jgi:general secretion pathway protein C
LARLPRGDVFAWVELVLLALIALQLARIVWAVVTPVGIFGDWRPRQADIPSAETRMALFSSFDPFFRTAAPGGDQVVTALNLKLFGTRLNEGSGSGSAIIATPDDMQASFAPGDEILPGVTLKSVAFDHVVIDRGGREETLFLDQSSPAPVAQPAANPAAASNAVPARPDQALTAENVQRDIAFAPRTENGRVTGLAVSPSGTGAAFQTAGFRPGDVIVQVNGRAIASAADIQTLAGQLAPGSRISLQVERGANIVPIAMILSSQ